MKLVKHSHTNAAILKLLKFPLAHSLSFFWGYCLRWKHILLPERQVGTIKRWHQCEKINFLVFLAQIGTLKSVNFRKRARVQGNLWKVGTSAGEVMEDGPKCRGTYGRWAQIQGLFEIKNAKKWQFKAVFLHLFFYNFFNFFCSNF